MDLMLPKSLNKENEKKIFILSSDMDDRKKQRFSVVVVCFS